MIHSHMSRSTALRGANKNREVDVEPKDKNGRTPLSYAEGAEGEDVGKLLMDALQPSGLVLCPLLP